MRPVAVPVHQANVPECYRHGLSALQHPRLGVSPNLALTDVSLHCGRSAGIGGIASPLCCRGAGRRYWRWPGHHLNTAQACK